MKKLLVTVALIATATATATSAFAQNEVARITRVEPNYQYVSVNNPVNRCYNVDVPVYGNVGKGATGGDVLGGMIVGGLLGKGITGNDDGAAAGAIFGGIIAADKGGKQGIVGYRTERQCETVNEVVSEKQLLDYKITYEWKGITATSRTYNYYNVGDRIPVSVSIVAQ
tara:strand:- start:269 stop:775 length:507 start_codon:yes stop_codon:yes gene_type:complete